MEPTPLFTPTPDLALAWARTLDSLDTLTREALRVQFRLTDARQSRRARSDYAVLQMAQAGLAALRETDLGKRHAALRDAYTALNKALDEHAHIEPEEG